jgi:hypothetical protein
MARTPFALTFLLCLASQGRAQSIDSLIRTKQCYRLGYLTPQESATSRFFPDTITLAPGRDSGQVIPDRTYVDSVFGDSALDRFFPVVGYWTAERDSVKLVVTNGMARAIILFPSTLGNSLIGRAFFHSDAINPRPPRMSIRGTRFSCH